MRGRRAAILSGLLLAACASSPPIPTIPSAPTGPLLIGEALSTSDDDGVFRLTIRSDQDRYRAGQPILITGELSYLGPAPEITASGSGTLVGFGVESADPRITIEPLFTGDCVRYTFTRDEPVSFPFVKSGSLSQNDPLALFHAAYFSSRDLRLAGGSWTINAVTTVYHDGLCGGEPSDLSASVTIDIEP